MAMRISTGRRVHTTSALRLPTRPPVAKVSIRARRTVNTMRPSVRATTPTTTQKKSSDTFVQSHPSVRGPRPRHLFWYASGKVIRTQCPHLSKQHYMLL